MHNDGRRADAELRQEDDGDYPAPNHVRLPPCPWPTIHIAALPN
jgi:hypothetical protein